MAERATWSEWDPCLRRDQLALHFGVKAPLCLFLSLISLKRQRLPDREAKIAISLKNMKKVTFYQIAIKKWKLRLVMNLLFRAQYSSTTANIAGGEKLSGGTEPLGFHLRRAAQMLFAKGFAGVTNAGKISLTSTGQKRCVLTVPPRAEQRWAGGGLLTGAHADCKVVVSTRSWLGWASALVLWVQHPCVLCWLCVPRLLDLKLL